MNSLSATGLTSQFDRRQLADESVPFTPELLQTGGNLRNLPPAGLLLDVGGDRQQPGRPDIGGSALEAVRHAGNFIDVVGAQFPFEQLEFHAETLLEFGEHAFDQFNSSKAPFHQLVQAERRSRLSVRLADLHDAAPFSGRAQSAAGSAASP